MERSDERYEAYCSILEKELVAAMGCTEPIAIALAAARARDLLGYTPAVIDVEASGSIIKNAKSVVVPHTGGLKGIEAAAAAGALFGRAERDLEVIAEVSAYDRESLARFLDEVTISVSQRPVGRDFDLIVTAYEHEDRKGTRSLVRIADFHTNIVREQINDEVVFERPLDDEETGDAEELAPLTMEGIWDFAMTVDLDDVRAVLERQITCNDAIADEGMAQEWGANVGKVLMRAYGDDVKTRACARAAAASDARMGGCELPVVINAGSGNQGITVSVPLIAYARELGCSEEKLYRALVLSNLVALRQKAGIGRLSAFCGAVCAGAAAGAGIAYLQGGGYQDAIHAIVNALSIVSGMVCDGAKPSCAAKIAFAVNAGILGYEMYAQDQQFYAGDGIVKKGVENTIDSVARLGREGMRATNEEIIDIMLGR